MHGRCHNAREFLHIGNLIMMSTIHNIDRNSRVVVSTRLIILHLVIANVEGDLTVTVVHCKNRMFMQKTAYSDPEITINKLK